MKIVGIENWTPQQVEEAVAKGGKFVYYQYCVSVIVMTFKRSSSIYFLEPGESALKRGGAFTALSLIAGWWGFPWGPIWTISTVVGNSRGGTDVTQAVLGAILKPAPTALRQAPK